MLFTRFAALLQCALGAMAASLPLNVTEIGPEDIQAFTTSLELSPDNEARVLEILTTLPDLNATTQNASLGKRTFPLLVYAGCEISRIALGANTLLEDAPIQQAVSQSWYV
jgi:hypothetical protein